MYEIDISKFKRIRYKVDFNDIYDEVRDRICDNGSAYIGIVREIKVRQDTKYPRRDYLIPDELPPTAGFPIYSYLVEYLTENGEVKTVETYDLRWVDHNALGKNVIVFEYEGKPWVDSIER